ncbi:MAG: PAS domain S-box protein [Candidatus Kariarchaeaceae archaeon]|jgi:PAS domain S-box-containing protein
MDSGKKSDESESELELLEQYKLLVNAGYEGIAITEKGKTIHVNKQLAQMFGYEVSEVIGITPFRFIAPESHEDVKNGLKGLKDKPYEFTGIKKDGTTFHCEAFGREIVHQGKSYRVTTIRDISLNRKTEIALRESEEKFRQISEQSLLGIYILQDDVLKYVNDKYCEIHGYSREELLSFGYDEINQMIHPDDRSLVEEKRKYRESGENDIISSFRVRLITKQGDTRWIEIHSQTGEYNNKSAIYGTLIDISDQIQANMSLKESEEKFRQISEQSLLGIYIIQDDAFKYVNDRYCEIHGYSREQLLSFNSDELTKLIHPDDLQIVEEQSAKKQKGERDIVSSFQYRIITKEGETRRVEVHSKTGNYKDKNAIYGTIIDFTEQYQTLKSLTESEERYRTLSDSSPVGILAIRKSEILYSNTRFLTMYGYGEDENIIGLKVQKFQPSEVRDKLTKRGQKREQGVDVISSYDSVGLKKDNEVFPIHVEVTKIILNDGPATLVFIQDLSEIKIAEEEKEKLQNQILQAEKFESLGILAGAIAHDFNNILMGITNYANLARSELDPESSIQDFLIQIERSSERAAELSKQMLALSGKGKFVLESIDMRNLILDERKSITTLLPNNIQLVFDFDDVCPPIDCDKSQLLQVVENLVKNSVEAIGTSPGEIIFKIGKHDFDVSQASEYMLGDTLKAGKFAYLEIIDNGVGFDDDNTDKMFDPFYTTKFVGRGLGLPVVLGIIRGHKGAIKVDSIQGKGTSIRIILPKSKKSKRKKSKELSGSKKEKRKNTILICDDEEDVRNVLKLILEKNKYKVLLAADGVDGIKAYKDNVEILGVVLLDLAMPKMNGDVAFKKMQKINSQIPIILMSGYSEQEALNRLPGKNLAGFLHKPYDKTTLLSMIKNVLK